MLISRFGRINILKKLLDSEKGSFIINEANGEGLTPLHIASKRGCYFCNLLVFEIRSMKIASN